MDIYILCRSAAICDRFLNRDEQTSARGTLQGQITSKKKYKRECGGASPLQPPSTPVAADRTESRRKRKTKTRRGTGRLRRQRPASISILIIIMATAERMTRLGIVTQEPQDDVWIQECHGKLGFDPESHQSQRVRKNNEGRGILSATQISNSGGNNAALCWRSSDGLSGALTYSWSGAERREAARRRDTTKKRFVEGLLLEVHHISL